MTENKQEIFEKAVTGLLNQGCLCKHENGYAVYVSEKNKNIKCPVAYALGDLYNPSIESYSVDDIYKAYNIDGTNTNENIPKDVYDFIKPHKQMFEFLQATHDYAKEFDKIRFIGLYFKYCVGNKLDYSFLTKLV